MAAGFSKASVWPRSGVVVWEWEENEGVWVSYDSVVSAGIEEAKRDGKLTLCLGDLTPELALYEVDLQKQCQRRIYKGSMRRVRRAIFPEGTPQADGVVWHWEERGHWLRYDNASSCVLEDHFVRKIESVDMSRHNPRMPYVMNVATMEQTNKRTGFKRHIRRVPFTRPYPAASMEDLGSSTATQTKSKQSGRKRKNKSGEMALGIQSQTQASVPSGLPAGAHPWLVHCKIVSNLSEESENEDCAICFENLCKPSDYSNGSEAEALTVVELKKCNHKFHKLCLQALYDTSSKSGSIQCPSCKAIHGVKIGNQPMTGRMTVSRMAFHLSGYPRCGAIEIQYNFHGGIQGPEHPHPGKPYSASGFPRTCYLPDNEEGNKVLQLLGVAWKRRLIFTIGESVTTGRGNTIVWNEIHHKTEAAGNAGGHGYPDPNYISNVLAELAAQGVEDDETE